MNKPILFACLMGIARLHGLHTSDIPGGPEIKDAYSQMDTGSTESTKLTETADQE